MSPYDIESWTRALLPILITFALIAALTVLLAEHLGVLP